MGDWGVEAYVEGINEKNLIPQKGEYNHFFHVTFVINFMHRHRMDFTYEIIGDQI